MVENEWRIIPGYEYYEVTKDGRVRSIDKTVCDKNGRVVNYRGKVLKQQINNKGYVYYTIKVPNKPQNLYAHRAVALAYIPNPDNKPCIKHVDNNPLNNNVENLEWCAKKEKQYKPVISTDLITGEQKIYEFLNAVREDGYNPGDVCTLIKHGWGTYRGKKWEYYNEANE